MDNTKLRYVISNKQAIGFLLPCAKGWKSYDQDGRQIGMFENANLAAKAVYEQASSTAS